jgi:hypothetical protein
MNRTSLTPQTIVKTKFLSTSEENESVFVAISGTGITLHDPISVPPAPLQYDEIQKTIQTFMKTGEFTSDDLKNWENFIDKHKEKIADTCPECIRLCMRLNNIGKIRNEKTEEQQKKQKEQKTEKEKIKNELKQHLKENIDTHNILNGWWCDALPKAGEDLPYIIPANISIADIEHKNEQYELQFQHEATQEQITTETTLETYNIDHTGKLIEPTGPLLYTNKSKKNTDIHEEMNTNVNQKQYLFKFIEMICIQVVFCFVFVHSHYKKVCVYLLNVKIQIHYFIYSDQRRFSATSFPVHIQMVSIIHPLISNIMHVLCQNQIKNGNLVSHNTKQTTLLMILKYNI